MFMEIKHNEVARRKVMINYTNSWESQKKRPIISMGKWMCNKVQWGMFAIMNYAMDKIRMRKSFNC